MRVGAAVGQLQAAVLQAGSQRGRVFLDPPHHLPERLGARDLERHGHGGELLRVRAALLAGEDRHVDAVGQILVGGHDDGAARAAERLVGGAGDHIGDADRVGEGARRRHAGRVADVGQQHRADLVGDGAEELPVGRPGVRRKPADDHLRPVAPRQVADLVVVQLAGALADAVADHVVVFAREVELAAVGQVAALVQVHAHDRVAHIHDGVVDRQVGRRAGEGLDVDINILVRHALVGEDQRRAALRQRLDEVHVVYALVEAAVGVAAVVGELVRVVEDRVLVVARHAQGRVPFSVDVVEDRAQRLADSPRCDRLGGDHDELAGLALLFEADDGIGVGIDQAEVGAEKRLPVLALIGLMRRSRGSTLWIHHRKSLLREDGCLPSCGGMLRVSGEQVPPRPAIPDDS